MLEDQLTRYEAAKLRWMTGGDADTVGDRLAEGHIGPEGQLRLLAGAGLFRSCCLRPETPTGLAAHDLLPEPPLPLLPEALRPAFRHMLDKNDKASRQGLLGLMAARGVMAHPFDWMPPQDLDGYPEAYTVFAKWRAGHATQAPVLSAECWDDLYPAERRNAFTRLRSTDPDAARALIEEKGSSLAAEERLMLISAFEVGLSEADQPYLVKVSTSDRSAKVKSKATGLLARLGFAQEGQDAQELADFMEQSAAGLLRRKVKIGPRKKLNEAQRKRMTALFEQVSLTQLAIALKVEPFDLVSTFVTEPRTAMAPFMDMCIRSASTGLLLAYWDRLKADKIAQFSMLADMQSRFEKTDLQAQVLDLLSQGRLTDLRDLMAVTGSDAGPEVSNALVRSSFYRERLAAAKEALAKRAKGESDYKISHAITQFETAVTMLAFLVTAHDARQIVSDLEAVGFHSADPLFRPLNFNIALEG